MEDLIMMKNELRAMGYADQEIIPKKWKISLLWTALTLTIAAGTFVFTFVVSNAVGIGPMNAVDLLGPVTGLLQETPFGLLLYFIVPVFMSLALKFILTRLICRNRKHSTTLKMLKTNSMPVCECKEALKVSQIILIYLIPFILTYTPLFTLGVLGGGTVAIHVIVTAILAFFWAFDLALVLYVLHIKIITGADYISVDHHVYNLTLFNKSYVRAKRKLRKRAAGKL
jgi:hypothetical protein